MKKLNILLLSTLLFYTVSYAKEKKQHYQNLGNNVTTSYEILDFTNSKKKENGKRQGIEIDHRDKQHHAMEFKRTYMLGIGYDLNKNTTARLRYIYQKAKEIPIDNNNVKVNNLTLNLIYKF